MTTLSTLTKARCRWLAKLGSRQKRYGYVLVAPAVLVLLLLTVYPSLYMLFVSFYDWAIVATIPRRFVGLGQYLWMVRDPDFRGAILVTVIFVMGVVLVEMVGGFILAMLLFTDSRGIRRLRFAFLIPTIIAPVVVGLTWRWMLSADLGVINYLIGLLGISKIGWLAKPMPALLSVMLVDIWQWTPFTMFIMLAGLESLPVEFFEAAYVDGASPWQVVRYIILPMLIPVIIIALMFRTLDAFKTFDIIYIVTRGGPANATNVLSYNIWRKGFFENNLGYAAALSVVMIILATVMTQVYIRVLTRVRRTT